MLVKNMYVSDNNSDHYAIFSHVPHHEHIVYLKLQTLYYVHIYEI